MTRTAVAIRGDSAATRADGGLAGRLRLVISRLGRQLRQQQVGGLTPSQLSALSSVDQHGPIRLGDLACRERVSPPTLTRCVGSLETLELVERQPDPDDRRSVLMVISTKGRRLLNDLRRERTAILTCRIEGLDGQARQALVDALPVLEQLVADDEPG
jgi:DNA-binding MarR family transcriptional regulator